MMGARLVRSSAGGEVRRISAGAPVMSERARSSGISFGAIAVAMLTMSPRLADAQVAKPRPAPADERPAEPADAREPGAEVDARVQLRVDVQGGLQVKPAFPVHLEYGLDTGVGAAQADAPIHGLAGMFAVPVNLYFTPWLGIGVRGQLVFSGDPAVDGDRLPGRVDDVESPGFYAWSGMIGPRLRVWSNDSVHGTWAARVAWVLDADIGVVYAQNDFVAPGPMARIAVGRQVLLVDQAGKGVNLGLALSAETGLAAAAEHRALLGSVWFHGEAGAAPAAGRTVVGPSTAPITFTLDVTPFLGTNFGEVETSAVVGAGVAYGVRVSEMLEPRVRADILYLRHPQADGTSALAGSAGLRLRLDRWIRLFVEVMPGYEFAYGTAPLPIDSGTFVDLASGFHFSGCTAGYDIGARLRVGVGADNDGLATLALFIAGARGGVGALGPPMTECSRTGGEVRGLRTSR